MRFRSTFTAALVLPITHVNAGAAAAAANALKSMDYRYFVAGGVCAATSHGITTPIDVVKTKLQADSKLAGKSLSQATVAIIRDDGPQALLAGLGPTVVGYGIEGAMKFGVYEVLKPVFADVIGGESTTVAFILASIVAGAVASLILCPAESVRIRQVTSAEYSDKGLLSALSKLIREEGLLSTFGGMYAMLAKQVPYTMAKQVSFDIIATLLYKLLGDKDMQFLVSVLAAASASLFACIFSQPGDVILTETFKGKDSGSFPAVISTIWGRGGVPAFFTGTSARIVHVGMIITSQLVIYDIVKQALGLPATGAH
jgi:solute carrier family 25 (mitochondrial phosphate transporter), member 3